MAEDNSENPPETASDYYNRGFWRAHMGNYDGAIEDYTESLNQKPNDVYALLNRGSAWARKGEYDKALADYEEAIRLRPNFTSAWFYRGAVWYDIGEYDKAIEGLSRAISLEANYVNAWKIRGDAFLEKGEYDKAVADYKEAHRLSPADEEITQKQTIAMAIKKSKEVFEKNEDIDEKKREKQIKFLINWFHERYETQPYRLPYKSRKDEHPWIYGGPYGVDKILTDAFPEEDSKIIDAAVKEIETHDFDPDLENTVAKLNSLIANSPSPQNGPVFSFGDDGLLHISSPPDIQAVATDDVLFEELKVAKDDLSQALTGTNVHISLLNTLEQYNQAFSDKKISISLLYARGIRIENVVFALKRSAKIGDIPPLSLDADQSLNSLLELHRTYIMSHEKGRNLVEAASAYRQSPQRTETLKAAGEQFNNSIASNPNLFGQDVKECLHGIVQDIGQGSHPERSNQVAMNTLLNLISGFLKGIKNNSVAATLATSAFVASAPGMNVVTTGTDTIDATWFFLSSHAPLLKIIAASAVNDVSWVISLSNLVDRLNYFQISMTQDLSRENFEK